MLEVSARSRQGSVAGSAESSKRRNKITSARSSKTGSLRTQAIQAAALWGASCALLPTGSRGHSIALELFGPNGIFVHVELDEQRSHRPHHPLRACEIEAWSREVGNVSA